MTTPPTSTRAHRLSERDVSYLKLLKTLKSAGGEAGAEMGVVRRIATWIDSAPVLNFIAAHQPWFDDWELKEGLLHNDLTPQRFRGELEKSITIFELLGEMDAPGITAQERTEIQEDVRYLFKTLPEHDRGVVKQRAYELSASRRGVPPKASGPVAEMDRRTEAPRPAGAPPDLSGQELAELVATGEITPDGSVTEAIHRAEVEAWTTAPPATPAAAPAGGLLSLEVADFARVVPSSIDQVVHDAEAGRWSPDEGGELDDADLDLLEAALLDEDEAAAAEAVPAEPEVLEAAPPVVEDAPPVVEEAPPVVEEAPPVVEEAPPVVEEAPASSAAEVGALPGEARVSLAATTADAVTLALLVHEPDPDLQVALVGNPALQDAHAAVLARHASSRAAEAIYRNRRLFSRPLVQRALLECPQAPSAALLEIVNGLGQIPALLALIRNPKVKFVEVKAKAHARLAMIFKSLGTGEKVAMIRQAGRSILKELWTDFFRDEPLVLKCLQERQVDEGVVLEIARSKVAPRRALEVIGTNPAWTNNYQIRLELVLNPKTPRQVVTRLLQKLNPADRKMIKRNVALPDSIRRHA